MDFVYGWLSVNLKNKKDMAFKIYSNCSTLAVGCYVFTDPERTIPLASTIISDGFDSFVTDGDGIIISQDDCIYS